MRVGYFYNPKVEYPRVGTQLTQYELKDILDSLPKLPRDHKKHMVGTMYFHTNNVVGVEFNPMSTGIVGCDIDKIDKEDCEKIMDNFDKLSLVFPCLVSCWYSHSYYNKPYGGLHLVIKTNKSELRYDDFAKHPDNSYRTQNMIYSAALAYYIYEVCGVDVRPKYSDKFQENSGLDKAMLRIGQQCFLNYSETVKWNDNIYDVSINNDTVNGLKKWFIGYKWFDNNDDEFKTVSYNVTHFDYEKILSDDFKPNTNAFYKENQLGHNRRIAVENFLAGLGWDQSVIVDFMMKICFGDDFKNGEAALRKAVIQTTKVAIRKYKDKPTPYAESARSILTALGVDIEMDLQKVYVPIDYQFDDIFNEVWESKKEELFFNVHYNRENWYRFQLGSGETLFDLSDELRPILQKYRAIYLVAPPGVGKSFLSMNMKVKEEGVLFPSMFGNMCSEGIDIIEPFNSVADSKTTAVKDIRKDIARVVTADIKAYRLNKRNMFIYDTVKPLYEKYFENQGIMRQVAFLDESHKLITDNYRWITATDMMECLPKMYNHVVYMTGTPAFEHEYLTEFYKEEEIAIVLVEQEPEYKIDCNVIKYEVFGKEDMKRLISDCIDEEKLPIIYSNRKNKEIKESILELNRDRYERGLKTLNVLDYCRDNRDNLEEVNKTGCIDEYDVAICTAYCGVGVDFLPGKDGRKRVAIIDYAGEMNGCTAHDVWQFANRNRKQEFEIIIPVRNEDFKKISRDRIREEILELIVRTDVTKIDDDDLPDVVSDTAGWISSTRALSREISEMKKKGLFEKDKNIRLVILYRKYYELFSNVNMIINYLKNKGVNVDVTESDHSKGEVMSEVANEIYRFFVDNWNEIRSLYSNKDKYEKIVYQTDINKDEKEYIQNGKIFTRNPGCMNWYVKNFTDDDAWKDILEKEEYLSKNRYKQLQHMILIANNIKKSDISVLKALAAADDEFRDSVIKTIIARYYKPILDKHRNWVTEQHEEELFNDFKDIMTFAIDNIKFVEETYKKLKEGTINAAYKMLTLYEIEKERKAKRKISDKKKKTYTVTYKNGKTKTFKGQREMAEYYNCSVRKINRVLNSKKFELIQGFQITDIQ